jgi:flavin-dependent dehydrogenase
VRRAGSLPSWEGNGMKQTSWDVVVVGSGPGGSVAAKVCAKAGLDTLLVEKKALPRDKVCTGMVMGAWAKNLIKEHFGEIPKDVLIEQGHYKGVTLHVGPNNIAEIPTFIPVGWRKNLDYWMCQKAMEVGVQVKDGTRVDSIRQHNRGYEVELKEETKKIYTKFLIGADGALSRVRKLMYPDLKVGYRPAYRECYEEQLSIDRDQFHWFFPLISSSPRFDINYKEDYLLIEGGSIRQIRDKMRQILQGYGFPPDAKPLWRDGCVIPALHDDFVHGSFLPARDNTLLVGDAAGLLLPFTHEGIGSALKSGFLAAESVVETLAAGKGKADALYLKKLEGMKMFLNNLVLLHREMDNVAKKGAGALRDAMAEFVEKSIKEDV